MEIISTIWIVKLGNIFWSPVSSLLLFCGLCMKGVAEGCICLVLNKCPPWTSPSKATSVCLSFMLFYLPLSWKKVLLCSSCFTICSSKGTLERLDLVLGVLFLGGMSVKQPWRIDCCVPDDLNIPPFFWPPSSYKNRALHPVLFNQV